MPFVYFIPDKDGKINSFKQDEKYKYYYGTTYNIENYLNCEYSKIENNNYICKKEDYDKHIQNLINTNRKYISKINDFLVKNSNQTLTKIERDDYNMILQGWNNYKKLKYLVDNLENLFGKNVLIDNYQESLNIYYKTYDYIKKLINLT